MVNGVSITFQGAGFTEGPNPADGTWFLIDTTGFMERKREAILAYRSQFVVNERNRRVVEWVDAAGTYFGSRIGTAAAAPFHAREPLRLTGLAQLA